MTQTRGRRVLIGRGKGGRRRGDECVACDNEAEVDRNFLRIHSPTKLTMIVWTIARVEYLAGQVTCRVITTWVE